MYIAEENERFYLTEQKKGNLKLFLRPPVILQEGKSQPHTDFPWEDDFQDKQDGLIRVIRRIRNGRKTSVKVQIVTEAEDCFEASRYLIPCVMYNGNEWGSRNSPRGLTKDGQPWIFAYDRTGIPSCTLTENEYTGAAIFADAGDERSLRSSCSLVKQGEHFLHRIFYPVVEAPVTYAGKNKMAPRYDEYLTLAPDESVEIIFWMYVCHPEWKNYACAALLDRLPEVFPYSHTPNFTPQRVWEMGINYLTRLIHDYQGRTLIIAGIDTKLSHLQAGHMGAKITPDEMRHLMSLPEYNTYGFNREIYEIGWAGQGFLSTRMLLKNAIARGDNALIDRLIGSLQNWVEKQQENGMVLPHFERYAEYDEAMREGLMEKLEDPCQGWFPDVCNLGWGASEMSKLYTLLKENGRERPELLRFATRICNFFCAHFDLVCGFGKLWRLDGTREDTTGTIGGFMVSALIDTWRVTKTEAYMETAIHAMDFYYTRDLDQFVCTAGAIDCQSVDKETSYPFVVAALDLYEITGEALWLERARKAAFYFFSWAFQYDALYPENSDFTKFGYYTSGGTAISAEHHAIDPWGALLCAEFIRLEKYTGDSRWRLRSQMMWNNSLYGITAHEGDIVHGLARPLGSQNEGFFQARWTKYRPDCEERGHFNDWLVSWVTCWRLTTLDRLTSVVGEKDWSVFN